MKPLGCWFCGKEATAKLLQSNHGVCRECARERRLPVVPIGKAVGACAVCGGWPTFSLTVVLVGVGLVLGVVLGVVFSRPVLP